MGRKFKLRGFVVMLCLMVVLSGCTKEDKPVLVEESPKIGTTDELLNDHEIVDSIDEKSEEKVGVQSPISGIYTDEENIHKRPFAVMLDNQAKARPQAGLDQAEVVYEILAEGWITRYMAVFLINEPQVIGPVRSARPYFIEKAMEYDALYVHVGGSPDAFADIKTLKIPDIDAMTRNSTIFWRKNHKSIPHNMYSSASAIRKAAKESNYNELGNFKPLLFHQEEQNIDGVGMKYVKIPYYKNYKPSFEYNEDKKIYDRYINDKPHVDEVSNSQLSAKNIIIQRVDKKIIDSEGRLEMDLVGKGTGYYLTQGNMIEVNWQKKSRKDVTRFYDGDGEEIKLNPGVTWIEVIPLELDLITEQ